MNKTTAIVGVMMLGVGLAAGYFLSQGKSQGQPVAAGNVEEPLYYRNPMNPNVTSPVPAKDSMGMDYIPD